MYCKVHCYFMNCEESLKKQLDFIDTIVGYTSISEMLKCKKTASENQLNSNIFENSSVY